VGVGIHQQQRRFPAVRGERHGHRHRQGPAGIIFQAFFAGRWVHDRRHAGVDSGSPSHAPGGLMGGAIWLRASPPRQHGPLHGTIPPAGRAAAPADDSSVLKLAADERINADRLLLAYPLIRVHPRLDQMRKLRPTTR